MENRKPLIQHRLKVGGLIITDGFKAYPRIALELGLQHEMVNYCREFVTKMASPFI